MTALERDFTVQEVAEALQMSPRWVRQKVAEGAPHFKYGHKLRFSAAHVAALRALHVKAPVEQSITTGRKRSR